MPQQIGSTFSAERTVVQVAAATLRHDLEPQQHYRFVRQRANGKRAKGDTINVADKSLLYEADNKRTGLHSLTRSSSPQARH